MKKENSTSLPFLEPSKIKDEADAFRKRFWAGPVPIDIVSIVEVQMDIMPVPVPGLRRFGIEAFITSDWKRIYVDKEAYEDEGNMRLRFSYAHEAGHLVLHKDAYESIGIRDLEDYLEFTSARSEDTNNFHRFAEVQADMFAGMLLIPTSELLAKKTILLERFRAKLEAAGVVVEDNPMLDGYLAPFLAEEFQVSESAMKVALGHLE